MDATATTKLPSLDDLVQDATIELIVNGNTFIVQKKRISDALFIRDIMSNDREAVRIELTLPANVTKPVETMQWIIDYIMYHDEDHQPSTITKPLVSDNLLESGVSAWDNEFISKTDEEIVNLSLSANYLNIPSLLGLCCAKIGAIMKSIVKQYKTKDEQMAAVKKRWQGTGATAGTAGAATVENKAGISLP
jgi:hypothetical protein